ncbi:MAG TPA: tetratricopeptide repeat protein [Anaerolineaceae bacterium]
MNLRLTGKKMQFRSQRASSSPVRVFFLLTLVLGGLFLLRSIGSGAVKPLYDITPTPTRYSTNYALEGQTHFQAGNLPKAIEAYELALQQEPENVQLWIELARIQAYSSSALSTDQEKYDRLQAALSSAERAVELNPELSMTHAIHAFVLDWVAGNPLSEDTRARLLTDAEQAAERALTLDSKNALAMAYNAEVLVDNQRWTQAEGYINQAMGLNKTDMDVYRVYAYVQESLGNYNESINAYKRAAEITPNLTFLYNSIARTYRHLRNYDEALRYYSIAVAINTNLGIQDPNPYIGIAKTYIQTGDFFAASLNVRKALKFDPANPDVYAQLGIVYWHARNYEGSIPAFRCALYGCDAETACEVRKCDKTVDPLMSVAGMPLTGSTVVYYYTYGSVLAAMHQKGDDLCNQAVQVLGQVQDRYFSDVNIMSIIRTSQEICATYGIYREGTSSLPTFEPTAEPSATPTLEATPEP